MPKHKYVLTDKQREVLRDLLRAEFEYYATTTTDDAPFETIEQLEEHLNTLLGLKMLFTDAN